MFYRSVEAQSIHTCLMKYIYDENPESFNQFKSSLEKANSKNLLELSSNGHSHLIDILNLPSKIIKNDEKKYEDVTKTLFKHLMDRCDNSKKKKKLKKFLLLTSDNLENSPIQVILHIGN